MGLYFGVLASGLIIFTSIFLRLLYILPSTNPRRPAPRRRGTSTHLLIVLGSGGHTAEMLSLLTNLDPQSYTHRTYIVSSGDGFSATKAMTFELDLAARAQTNELSVKVFPSSPLGHLPRDELSPNTLPYSLYVIPRARKIHQSLLTTPLSSFHCLLACLTLLRSLPSYPDLILLNGPATSVLVLLACFILRFFAFPGTKGKMRSIYVESWARVKSLSLSGKILTKTGMTDRFLVQWESLARTRAEEFRGCLVP